MSANVKVLQMLQSVLPSFFRSALTTVTVGVCAAVLAGCERPPIEVVQTGYRGTAMQQIYNPRTLAKQADINVAPPALEAASTRPDLFSTSTLNSAIRGRSLPSS